MKIQMSRFTEVLELPGNLINLNYSRLTVIKCHYFFPHDHHQSIMTTFALLNGNVFKAQLTADVILTVAVHRIVFSQSLVI